MGPRRRVHAAQRRARPDRARRPPRLRLRLGGRAPLPRGVQPLVGAGGVPRCGQPADVADPPRSRHRAAADEPPGARRRAGEHARPDQPRPCRARCRRGEQHHRAAPVRPPVPRQAGRVGGRHALPPADVLGGGLGVPRRVLRLPAAQRRAQAAAAAAPAAVGGVQPARHDRDGRPPGDRRARLPVRLRRGRPRLGARLLQLVHQAPRPARSVPDEPEHRHRLPVHVRRDGRGGADDVPTARRSSSSPCASTTPTARWSRARSACGTST